MKEFERTADIIEKRTRKLKNWSTLGESEAHGFWLKQLTGLHPHIAKQFNILQGGEIKD